MIENLNGIHETVNFKTGTNLRLYHNVETEDYPDHWHTPIEIIMPLENIYSVAVGRQTVTLQPRDLIFICPGVIHALKAPPEGSRIIFQAELKMFSAIQDFASIVSLMSPALKITAENSPDIHRQICALLLQIYDEYHSSSLFFETAIYAKLLNIFVLIGSNFTDKFEHLYDDRQSHKEYIEKFLFICNYINEHCTENLCLDDIAKLAGFSKYHFTRLFKQFTATTFYRYLNQRRIEHAQRLLTDPAVPITDAALNSGYTSLSAFIRMFKLITQCTPTEYRNLYTKTIPGTPKDGGSPPSK